MDRPWSIDNFTFVIVHKACHTFDLSLSACELSTGHCAGGYNSEMYDKQRAEIIKV